MLGVVLSSFLGYMSHLSLAPTVRGRLWGDTHFTPEEAEAQRGSVIYLRSPS